MAETKPKLGDSLRTPKPKKKLGLIVPPALRLPHDDLIPVSVQKAEESATTPSQTSTPSLTRRTSENVPVSPIRDFTKVANSINREAVPAGLFTGKSKQLYDCLYSLSRGAVVPSRTVRMSRPKLMKRAGIGARVTFDTNVERLIAVGLIQVRRITGEHDGNEYTVFLPEEVGAPSVTSQTSVTSHAQNLVRLDGLDSSQTRHTSTVENKDISVAPNTFINTYSEKADDDEAFAVLVKSLRQAVKDVTGKEPSSSDANRWGELAELLVTELKIAAGRTGSVSNAPAFLTEHLRRRLWKKEKAQLEREGESPTAGEAKPKIDVSKCPDCFGTNYYYPHGFDRGVARCTHEKLRGANS